MLLERIYDEDLAQASYVIGCQAKNEAMVVDPRRDIQVYLDLAAKAHAWLHPGAASEYGARARQAREQADVLRRTLLA